MTRKQQEYLSLLTQREWEISTLSNIEAQGMIRMASYICKYVHRTDAYKKQFLGAIQQHHEGYTVEDLITEEELDAYYDAKRKEEKAVVRTAQNVLNIPYRATPYSKCENRRGYVYFIYREGDPSKVKIGFSSNVKQRIKDLNIGVDERLVPLLFLSASSSAERTLQNEFEEYKTNTNSTSTEWFYYRGRLKEFVNRCLKET